MLFKLSVSEIRETTKVHNLDFLIETKLIEALIENGIFRVSQYWSWTSDCFDYSLDYVSPSILLFLFSEKIRKEASQRNFYPGVRPQQFANQMLQKPT